MVLECMEQGIGDVVFFLFEDVNLKCDKILEKFNEIKNFYFVYFEVICEVIVKEVLLFDELLGCDWDILLFDKKGMSECVVDGVLMVFFDVVVFGVFGLILYCGLVWMVMGVNSYVIKVCKVYECGLYCWMFLKGIGMVKGCEYLVFFLFLQEEELKILFCQVVLVDFGFDFVLFQWVVSFVCNLLKVLFVMVFCMCCISVWKKVILCQFSIIDLRYLLV